MGLRPPYPPAAVSYLLLAAPLDRTLNQNAAWRPSDLRLWVELGG
jgi:hypothetical protein